MSLGKIRPRTIPAIKAAIKLYLAAPKITKTAIMITIIDILSPQIVNYSSSGLSRFGEYTWDGLKPLKLPRPLRGQLKVLA